MKNEAFADDNSENFDQSKSNRFLLVALPIGHLVNDWPGAALWILAPAIALSMGLGPVEVGLLLTIHAAGASLAYLPAGLVGDLFGGSPSVILLRREPPTFGCSLSYLVLQGLAMQHGTLGPRA